MADERIIVWDPEGEYWQGGIVDVATAMPLAARGVAMLPIDRRLLKLGALGGFFFRAWGAGWPVEGSVPRMCCPMALRVAPFDGGVSGVPNRIYWVARLVPDGVPEEKWKPLGTIRLAPDSGQQGAFGNGLTTTPRTLVDLSTIGKADEHGGWTVGGDAVFGSQLDQTIGLGLYCSCPGVRIAWAAVSQAD
jgi:hypothetical protein